MIKKSILSFLLFLSLSVMSFPGGSASTVQAQTSTLPDLTEWTVPINLSHSGSTSNSQLIIDSKGRFYALWLDKYNGYMAADSVDGKQWSKPVKVNFPFGINDGSPLLLADSIGYIHAFWIDSTNSLIYSRVLSDYFASSESWDKSSHITESTVDFNVVIDSKGTIHLAYIRVLSTDALPAGVYYRTSKDGGANWDVSQQLYISEYFRSLKPEDANVKLSVSKDGTVFVVWDNRPLKLILFTKSANGQNSWTVPAALNGRIVDSTNFAFAANVTLDGNNILITWRTGQPSSSCDQYSAWSTDNGTTWSEHQLVSHFGYGCSSDSKQFVIEDGLIVLIETIENQPTILAWNGSQWSNRQNILTGFYDPETSSVIDYQVQSAALISGNQISVIGYDDMGLGDTWFTSRTYESIASWFPNPNKWSVPVPIMSTPSAISLVSLTSDERNQFHILWIQDDLINGTKTSSIYYSKFDGILWTQPQAIYTAPRGSISQLNSAVDHDHLMVVWSEGPNDQVFFNWANIDTAQNPSEWTSPVELSTLQYRGGSPKILIDNTGVVYVVYAKPINEERGIYLVKSTDGAKSWTSPQQVFNASAAGWDLVDNPSISTDQNGMISMSWAKKSYPGDGHLLAIYTSQSADEGLTWSNPSVVDEGKLTWSQVIGLHDNIYRVWQDVDTSTQLVNWYQSSIDGGTSWSSPTSVTDPENSIGSPGVTTDSAGRLYLLQPIQITPQITGIAARIWNTSGWQVADRIILDGKDVLIPGSLTTAISPSGNLMVAFIDTQIDASTGNPRFDISYVNLLIGIPQTSQIVVPTISAQATDTPAAIDNSLINPTPTVVQDASDPSSEQNAVSTSSGSPMVGIIFGGAISAIIVAAVFGYRYLVTKRH